MVVFVSPSLSLTHSRFRLTNLGHTLTFVDCCCCSLLMFSISSSAFCLLLIVKAVLLFLFFSFSHTPVLSKKNCVRERDILFDRYVESEHGKRERFFFLPYRGYLIFSSYCRCRFFFRNERTGTKKKSRLDFPSEVSDRFFFFSREYYLKREKKETIRLTSDVNCCGIF